MCLPKKTVIQYKNAIKEVKQKLKTVELEWQNLDKAVKKDEEKGLLPKPTPPMFYINYAKKTLTINFSYEKQQ